MKQQLTDLQLAKNVLEIIIPTFITYLSFFIVEVITMVFTGHLGDPVILAGVGLGTM